MKIPSAYSVAWTFNLKELRKYTLHHYLITSWVQEAQGYFGSSEPLIYQTPATGDPELHSDGNVSTGGCLSMMNR